MHYYEDSLEGIPMEGPICRFCRHVTQYGKMDGIGWKCKAYPLEIPMEIVTGEKSHEKPITYDKGYQFESVVLPIRGKKYQVRWDTTIYEVKED
jgi:hypothetical protein